MAGKTLHDYPHLLDEWDTERNEPVEDIGAISAGSGIRPHWKCPKCGRRWRAWLTDRTSRLTQCRTCNRQWADEKTSIAGVHPNLVAEWDVVGNDKKSPERTKATSDRPVLWLCPAEPDQHPAYPMSPMARANWLTRGKPGCPECRKRLTKAAQRATRAKTVRKPTETGAASVPRQ